VVGQADPVQRPGEGVDRGDAVVERFGQQLVGIGRDTRLTGV
jgi:hypothetical protein